MISVHQWRVTIGQFSQPPARHRSKEVNKHSKPHSLNNLCARLFVTGVLLWAMYIEHITINTLDNYVLTHNNYAPVSTHNNTNTDVCHHGTSVIIQPYLQPYVNTIMIAMDVEQNPGPTMSAELQQVVSAVVNQVNENMNAKFDVVQHQLLDLSNSVNAVKREVNDLKTKVSTLENAQLETTDSIDGVIKRIETLESERERQEQYSRRENVILHGLAEETGETYDSLRKKATDLLNSVVKDKEWREADILRTHRLGKPRSASSGTPKPRPLIIRFVQFHDKLAVLNARAMFKDNGIGVKGDLTQKQRAMLANIPDNKHGYFKSGQLVIVDRPPRDQPSDTVKDQSSADRGQHNSRHGGAGNSGVSHKK